MRTKIINFHKYPGTCTVSVVGQEYEVVKYAEIAQWVDLHACLLFCTEKSRLMVVSKLTWIEKKLRTCISYDSSLYCVDAIVVNIRAMMTNEAARLYALEKKDYHKVWPAL